MLEDKDSKENVNLDLKIFIYDIMLFVYYIVRRSIMSCNINEYIDELKVRNSEISSINMEIKNKTEEYEGVIGKLNERLSSQMKDVQNLKNTKIFIKIGELIDELSWLSGISVDKIKVEMKFNMKFSNLDEFFQFTDDVKARDIKNIRLRLWSDNENIYNNFDYFMFLSMDTNFICSDGKRLIEHFSALLKPFSCCDELDVTFSVNDNFNNIIFNLNLGEIEHTDNSSWYPSDLFSQAVFNCVQRDYDRRVDKIRKRVKE